MEQPIGGTIHIKLKNYILKIESQNQSLEGGTIIPAVSSVGDRPFYHHLINILFLIPYYFNINLER